MSKIKRVRTDNKVNKGQIVKIGKGKVQYRVLSVRKFVPMFETYNNYYVELQRIDGDENESTK